MELFLQDKSTFENTVQKLKRQNILKDNYTDKKGLFSSNHLDKISPV